MLNSPNLKILEDFSFEKDIDNLDNIFQNVLIELKNYLVLNPILQNIKFLYKSSKESENLRNNIFNIGVNRHFESGILVIEVFENYRQFLPIV